MISGIARNKITLFLLLVFGSCFSVFMISAATHYHNGRPCTANHASGDLDNDIRGSLFTQESQHLQDAKAIKLLLHEIASLNTGGHDHGSCKTLEETLIETEASLEVAESAFTSINGFIQRLSAKERKPGLSPDEFTSLTKLLNDRASLVVRIENLKRVLALKGERFREIEALRKQCTEKTGTDLEDLKSQIEKLEGLDHHHHDLDEDGKAKIKRALQRRLDLLTNESSYGKAALNGLGYGVCGSHYKPTGEPAYDIITGILGKISEPAGQVITEHGKSFWTRTFNGISRRWNRVSNLFFGTATFTTRELEAWKADIKDLVKAFEDSYKRASATSASSHGLALRSGVFSAVEGCQDASCSDTECGEKKPQIAPEDPALKARKMFCQMQIQNILQEVLSHKTKSKSNKGLWERATHVEIALQALHDCIARQTSLNELSSAAAFEEICMWRDLTTVALNSIITAIDPLADTKNRIPAAYNGYGYGGPGTNPY